MSVEFDHGDFAGDSLDVGLDYPGIPLDDTDTPPQLYLSHGGLGLKLHPLTLSGTVGVGITPLAPPGEGDEHSFIFSLTGSLSVAFGAPVTVTLGATGFLYKLQIADGTLTYRIPNQVTLTGQAKLPLGLIEFSGRIGAIVDLKNKVFGGKVSSKITLKGSDIHEALCKRRAERRTGGFLRFLLLRTPGGSRAGARQAKAATAFSMSSVAITTLTPPNVV